MDGAESFKIKEFLCFTVPRLCPLFLLKTGA
jgi:hypothetical protein